MLSLGRTMVGTASLAAPDQAGRIFGAFFFAAVYYVLFLVARLMGEGKRGNHLLQWRAWQPGYLGPSFRVMRFVWMALNVGVLYALEQTDKGVAYTVLGILLAIPTLVGYAIYRFARADAETKKNVLVALGLLTFTWIMGHAPSHDGINGGMSHPAPGVDHSGDPVSVVLPTHQTFGNDYLPPST